jgi:hypothetical protein
MMIRRMSRPAFTNLVAVLLTIGLLAVMVWLMVTVDSQNRTIDQLSANNDALRSQVQDLGENPVAPPADSVTGQPGDPGPTGPPGPRGPSGSDGRDGTDGADGLTGVAGQTGPPGPVGAAGSSGADGQSITGPSGPSGPAGADGAPGAPGQPGTNGADGRGIASVVCEPDGTWTITYTDSTTSSTSGPCRIPDPIVIPPEGESP